MSETIRPKARDDLSVIPIQHEGRTLFFVQDPLEILEEPICLTEVAGLLLSLMDGTRTLSEIQSMLDQANGGMLPENLVSRQYEEMEKIGLLDTESYRVRRAEITDDFLRSDRRPPSHAEVAYDSDPKKLASWIEQVLGESESAQDGGSLPAPRVLVAPHIDFRVNTRLYGDAYSTLRGRSYDRVVLMGTGHSILEGVFCPTRKDFETPLGTTRNDHGSVDRIVAAGGELLSSDDFPHKGEHALEFQLIFLQHVLGADRFEVVPILCGSFHHLLSRVNRLNEDVEMQGFLEALRDVVFEEGRNVLVVAGVDFSHIGLRFSHPVPAAEIMEDAERHDRNLIEAFLQGEPRSFWKLEAETSGRYNVCGFSTLATILELFEGETGRLLGYDVWDDSPTGSAVSFAAMTL